MYTDPLLKEKWRVQKKLAREAGYDAKKLIENAHKTTKKLAEEMKINIKYSDRKGGYSENEEI